MPFSRPTLAQLIARTKADVTVKIGTQASALRRAWVTIFSTVLAGMAHLLYGFIAWAVKQFFSDTAEREALLQQGAIYGFSLKPAEYAQGKVRINGTNGTAIPVNTVLKRSDGVRYYLDIASSVSGFYGEAHVKAFLPGADGNLQAAQVLSLESPVAGLTGTAAVSPDPFAIEGGVDEEDIEAFRSRLLLRKRNPPQGGSKADYKAWALEISGVGDAIVYAPREILGDSDHPIPVGGQITPPFGDVWIYITSGDPDNPAPSGTVLGNVQTYIETKKSATANVSVFAVAPHPQAFTMNVAVAPGYSQSDAQTQITAELKDLFIREGGPYQIIRISQINDAISNAVGEAFHELLSPLTDIQMAYNEQATVTTPITVNLI